MQSGRAPRGLGKKLGDRDPNRWRETTSGKLDRKTSALGQILAQNPGRTDPRPRKEARDDEGEAASILRGGAQLSSGRCPPPPSQGWAPEGRGAAGTRTFPVLSFIYLKGRETELGVFHSWFLPLMPTRAGAETPPGPPTPELSLLPPKVRVGRELEPAPELGLETQAQDWG